MISFIELFIQDPLTTINTKEIFIKNNTEANTSEENLEKIPRYHMHGKIRGKITT